MVLTKRDIIPPPRETAQILQELINNRKQIKAREYERNRRKLTAYEFIENASKPLVNVMKGMFEDINSWDIRKLKDGRVGYARLSWENIEAILTQLNRMDRNEAVEILADVANKLPNPLTEQRELINKLGAMFAQTPKEQSVSIEQLNKMGMVAEPGTTSHGAMGAYRRRAGRFTGVYAPTGQNPFPSEAPQPTGAEATAESEQLPRGESSIPNLRRQYGDAILGFTGEILKIGHPDDIRQAVEQGKKLAVEGLTDGAEDNLRQSEVGRVVLKSMEAFKDSQGENGERARQNALKDLKLYFTAMNIAEDLKGRPYDIQKLIELSETRDSTFGAQAAESYTGLSEAQRHARQYEAPLNPALGMDDEYFGESEFRESPPESPRELPVHGNVARDSDIFPIASAPMSGAAEAAPPPTVYMEQLLPLKDVPTEPSAPPMGDMPEELKGIFGRRPHFKTPEEMNKRLLQEAGEVWDRTKRLGIDEHVRSFKMGIDTTNLEQDYRDTGETEASQLEQIKNNIYNGDYPLKDTLADIFSYKYKSVKDVAQDIVSLVEGMAQMDAPPAFDIIRDVAEGKRPPRDMSQTPFVPPEGADMSSDGSSVGREVARQGAMVVQATLANGEPVAVGDVLGNKVRDDYKVEEILPDGSVRLSFRDGKSTITNKSPLGVNFYKIKEAQGSGINDKLEDAGFKPNKKWNPLKLSASGDLGDINVSLPRLLENMELVVKKKKGGKVMMRKKNVPLDLIRLLTRRYNPKITYSDDAKGIYRKIINLAKVPLGQSHSQKEHIMGTGFKVPTPHPSEETEIIEEHKPDDVLEKLMVALGTWKNGNRNNIVKNKISSYADFLLKHNLIDKKEHKLLHELIQTGKAMTPELNEFLNEIFS